MFVMGTQPRALGPTGPLAGAEIAIVSLARKLAGILFALWRDGTEFKSC